eukprot:TRINITY_DN19551_c0_g1_i1.p1 TRINITY_DN19551_c0_g1~~TRINITY_DN19551_c0_g1_i1.p1  ORF type:complete len:413 (+),score=58.35 TRINITY_DN19551_c0_g1_i1:255-1493(+)
MSLHRPSRSGAAKYSTKEKDPVISHSSMQGRSSVTSMPMAGKVYQNLIIIAAFLLVGALMFLLSPSMVGSHSALHSHWAKRYLYWGNGIDCPGKHCSSCEGLGHQESSLRCALEEALFLQRTFVMPSYMCINRIHNDKRILDHSGALSNATWASNFCAMDSLYDLDLISKTVPVILDNSKEWQEVISALVRSGSKGLINVQGVGRKELKENALYREAWVLNRTASPLSWFMECKNRNNHSSLMLPYTFLPKMASKKLRDVAEQIKKVLGDYDAIHVRRGDKLKIRADRFGVNRTLHPHLDRDTRPEGILRKVAPWIPEGRTLFIASNERTPGFFAPLSRKYRLAYSSNFTTLVENVAENNYQLFMLERLIMYGAKTFVKTFKEDPSDLALSDDPKKNLRGWQIPVYTFDEPV